MKEGSQTPSSTMKCHVVTSAKVSEPNAVNRPKRVKQRKIKKPCRICKSADKCHNLSAPQCNLIHITFCQMMDSFCRETFFGAVFLCLLARMLVRGCLQSHGLHCAGQLQPWWQESLGRWRSGDLFFLGTLPPWATGARGYIMDLVPQNSSLYHLIYGGLAAIAWILGKKGINREGKNFDRNLLLLWTM